MVLLGTYEPFRRTSGCKGPLGEGKINIDKIHHRVRNLIFNLCNACHLKIMAAIPPSAFTAGRIRETQRDRDMKVAKKLPKAIEFTKFFETMFAELSPLKYNSKLMNSIWGLYNRYSPHNVKKINEAFVYNGDLQQSAANSSNKAEPVITLPPAALDNVWAAMNVSQSH